MLLYFTTLEPATHPIFHDGFSVTKQRFEIFPKRRRIDMRKININHCR